MSKFDYNNNTCVCGRYWNEDINHCKFTECRMNMRITWRRKE